MQFGNCPICGKLYAKTPIGMCPECFAKEEEYERIVAEYIREHHRCTVQEVNLATGISERTIYRMIKSGRVMECKDLQYPCAKCGKLINEGRLCKSCMNEFTAEAEKVTKSIRAKQEEQRAKSGHGMYTKNM